MTTLTPKALKSIAKKIREIDQNQRRAAIQAKIDHYKKTGNTNKLAIYESKL